MQNLLLLPAASPLCAVLDSCSSCGPKCHFYCSSFIPFHEQHSPIPLTQLQLSLVSMWHGTFLIQVRGSQGAKPSDHAVQNWSPASLFMSTQCFAFFAQCLVQGGILLFLSLKCVFQVFSFYSTRRDTLKHEFCVTVSFSS